MKITVDDIEKQIRNTKQVRFELVSLLNWIKYEKPDNADNMAEALNNVYSVLDDTQRTLNHARQAMAEQGPLEVPVSREDRRGQCIPVLSVVCK